MTIKEAMAITGCATKSELAKLLGISRQAVSNMGNNITEAREYQIRAMVAEAKMAE